VNAVLQYLGAYLATGLAFGLLDAVYLTVAGQKVYRPTLEYALADKPHMPTAIVFYLVYILGILLLAVLPNRDGGLGRVAVTGAILGAMCYATYDLTNQATLKAWSTRITLIDISWGTFVSAAGASAGYLAWRWMARTFG
jgi:uncharacterized membrane protein